MERAIIIVKGRVQKVGYRDLIAEIANSLDIGGIAENLPDGTVRIIAEAEKKKLEDFIREIQPRDDPMIKVTGVDARFEPATGKFEYFDIKHEDLGKEGFERIGVAAMYLKQLNKGQNQMLGKQDTTIQEVKTVGVKVDYLRDETKQDFDRMDIKYDKVSDKMDSIDNTLKGLTKAILKLAEKSA